MIEPLFKLKKDGKTVAYSKWTEHLGWQYSLTAAFKNTFTHYVVAQTQPITAHPFVTKDKNGKDVFAGDKIRRVNYTGDPKPRENAGEEGVVVWHHGFLQWSLKVGSENSYLLNDLADSEIFEDGIELIEAKDND